MRAPGEVRVDKWLWAARFFKTRGLAREAVSGGKVRLNGARVKPARGLGPGDRLSIQRGEDRFEITVREVTDRRGPASEAAALYHEDPASRHRREAAATERALQRAARAGRERRPDKRQRRRLIRFRQQD
ncbi:S4 domain-containing protein [Hydrogenophaga sp.]|uniref:RNA-binding S4 domain-containing protein n=1 Tax=Hydrogenophaga sp. TaxID=1904254 RepID=UPI0025BF6DE4|nr:S4 domain-containing protein [Hydrogenophaga sp.]